MARLRVNRKSYIAERGGSKYRVPATSFFIEDRGEPGRGPRLFGLRGGRFGDYRLLDKDLTRHEALNESVDKYGALSVFRGINALSVLNKNRPSLKAVAEEDKIWLGKFRDSKGKFKS